LFLGPAPAAPAVDQPKSGGSNRFSRP